MMPQSALAPPCRSSTTWSSIERFRWTIPIRPRARARSLMPCLGDCVDCGGDDRRSSAIVGVTSSRWSTSFVVDGRLSRCTSRRTSKVRPSLRTRRRAPVSTVLIPRFLDRRFGKGTILDGRVARRDYVDRSASSESRARARSRLRGVKEARTDLEHRSRPGSDGVAQRSPRATMPGVPRATERGEEHVAAPNRRTRADARRVERQLLESSRSSSQPRVRSRASVAIEDVARRRGLGDLSRREHGSLGVVVTSARSSAPPRAVRRDEERLRLDHRAAAARLRCRARAGADGGVRSRTASV